MRLAFILSHFFLSIDKKRPSRNEDVHVRRNMLHQATVAAKS